MRFSFDAVDDKHDSKLKVTGKEIIKISESEQSALVEIGFIEDSLNIYKSIEYRSKYTSMKSRPIATIDYIVKTKKNKIGAIKYFFAIQNTIHIMIQTFKVIATCDQFNEISSTKECEAIPFSEIKEKLLFLKFNDQMIVALIPNSYEKT